MRKTWKQILVGGCCGAWLLITASCTSSPVSIRHEHDEPVIIENGSVIVDFNRRDNKGTKGLFTHVGGVSTFLREDADPVELIRVWKKTGTGPFVEVYCSNNAPCSVGNWQSNALRLGLSSGKDVFFTWSFAQTGLKMVSANHEFFKEPRPNAKNPHRIRTKVLGGSDPKVDVVEFKRGNDKETFTRGVNEDIRVMLCIATTAGKCTEYDPNKPWYED